ncbi:MAG: hypothetical protein ABJA79_10245, partial [Parafilimonas sp.]
TNDCDPVNSCTQDISSLVFDAYFPKKSAYPYYETCPLPCLILAHSGGYAECSSKEKTPNLTYMCREFARRGWCVFNIEYRRGRIVYGTDPLVFPFYKTVSQELAGYRGAQDFKGAVRSILKMSDYGYFSNYFKLDKEKMFWGGQSAGAGIVVGLCYEQNQSMVDALCPTLSAHLGSIDANYYFAPPTYTLPTVKGVYNGWGCFQMPGTIITHNQATAFFAQNNYIIPVICFQGLKDQVTPYDERPEGYALSPYNTTNYCLDLGGTASVTPGGGNQDLLMIGPKALQCLVQAQNKLAEVYIDIDMKHGLDDNGPNYASNFGTSTTNTTQTSLYMVQRTCCFFQNIITGTTITGTSYFVECENYRHSCNTNDDDNGCNDVNAYIHP